MKRSASSQEFFQSPIGTFKIELERGILQAIHLGRAKRKHKKLSRVQKQLAQYFSKKRKSFDLVYQIEGTDFQTKVWNKLLEIPYGETLSYKELAQEIRRPNAVRAVGSACGRNPLPIVIPCHRVIGSSGEMGGFSLGLSRKSYLLELEQSSAR